MAANQSTILRTEANPLDTVHDAQVLSVLQEAAKAFIKRADGTVKIWAASRDWFLEEWGRDTFISLPGLLLTTKRYEDAEQVFAHFAKYEQAGLIPNVIRGDDLAYNTADASLWFIHALKAYVHTTDNWLFAATVMPTVRNIIGGYTEGTFYEHAGNKHQIRMDLADGLVISPAQSTWMDADPAGDGTTIVTPRNGKCVEINALWYGAVRFVIDAEKRLDEKADVSQLEKTANLVQSSFAAKFWNTGANCLFDVIEGDPHGSAIRPNQIFAISHGEDLLDYEKQQQILEVVDRELVAPGGLRTLSPQDPEYRGYYDTTAPVSVKDLAYHQGTIWPWLIGPYTDAIRVIRGRQDVSQSELNEELGSLLGPLLQFCLDSEFKSLPEVFSGDPPYEPGGTTSQAWSVAEALRVLDSVC